MLALASLLVAFTQVQAGAPAAPGSGAPAAAVVEAPAVPVKVTATASKSEVSVGEPFTIELRATGPAGASYSFAGEASTDELELNSLVRAPDAPAPEPGTHRYEAKVFALGELQIPPLPVRYRLADGTEGEARSGPVALKVVSLLSKQEEPKLADIRGPASVGVGRAFWIALAVLLLLVAAGVILLLRRRRPATTPLRVKEPELAPDVEALRALAALAKEGLPARGQLRPFYIRLSTIAKRYLERRLAAPILEMTSAETLALLRNHRHGSELLPVVRDLAEAADRVKFARGQGLAPEAERHLAAVRALVQALEAKLRPPVPAAKGKAA